MILLMYLTERVTIDGDSAKEVTRHVMENRIREVKQGPDDAIWAFEDRDGGRLLKLTPIGSTDSP